MDIGNIHPHTESLGRYQHVKVAIAKALVHLAARQCVQACMKAFHRACAQLRQFLRHLFCMVAPSHKDDDGAALPCFLPIVLRLPDGTDNGGQTLIKHLLEGLTVAHHSPHGVGLHLNMCSQRVLEHHGQHHQRQGWLTRLTTGLQNALERFFVRRRDGGREQHKRRRHVVSVPARIAQQPLQRIEVVRTKLMAPLVYAMGFVHHGIFQTAVGLQTLAQHLDERVASEAFRRHV